MFCEIGSAGPACRVDGPLGGVLHCAGCRVNSTGERLRDRGAFESRAGGIYDPADAVVEWESLLAGSPRALAQAGERRVVTEISNDGCYVFVLLERLVTLLAEADQRRLDEVAREWARLRWEDGEDIGDGEAIADLGELAGLARMAPDQGSGLLCSVT